MQTTETPKLRLQSENDTDFFAFYSMLEPQNKPLQKL